MKIHADKILIKANFSSNFTECQNTSHTLGIFCEFQQNKLLEEFCNYIKLCLESVS